jgi:hypothetical protein
MFPPPDARQQRAHDDANACGQAGYVDPYSGLFVMTASGLLRQRSCCGRGCRHCPWPPEEQARAGRPGS